MKPVIFTIVFILCVQALHAQKARQLTFTHYTSSSGLVSEQVNSMVQDEKGYIWIATNDGLQRFDGIRFKTFRHRENDSSSLSSNAVLQLLIDKNKKLRLLMANGDAGIFDPASFTFRKVSIKTATEASSGAAFRQLITDEAGNLFLLFGGYELLTWSETGNDFSADNNFFTIPDGWKIVSFIHQPGTQKYWIGLEQGGIAIYNKATHQLNYKGHNPEQEAAVDRLAGIPMPANFLFDRKGRLWFDSWLGLGTIPYIYCYDTRSRGYLLEKIDFYPELKTFYTINGFMEQHDGTIWIKGGFIFCRYLEKEKKFDHIYNGYENERGISYRGIKELYEDREYNIWVGTGNNGIFRFSPAQEYFTNVYHTNPETGHYGDGNPLCFLEARDGSILSGMLNDGLFRYDKNFNPLPLRIQGIPGGHKAPVWHMCASADSNTIWMGAQLGFYAYDQKKGSARFYNPALFKNQIIRRIQEDKSANLWICTQSMGVFKWDAKKGRKRFEDGLRAVTFLPKTRVYDIMIDKQGLLWIATNTDGVYVVDTDADRVLMHFGENEPGERKLPEKTVAGILEYNDSLVILVTPARIFLYNRVLKTSSFLGKEGTTRGEIRAIKKDDEGNLWLSTTTALYKANIRTRIFVRFNSEDGIGNDFFILASSCKLRDGRLLYGSSGQFIVFNPAAIVVSDMYPNLAITDIRVMDHYVRLDSVMRLRQLNLRPTDNSLVVEFSPLIYSNAFIIQYKLDGLDKEWKNADISNQAVYSYLPPGNYTLQFNIMDAEGKSKNTDTHLIIRVNPPVWKTWWFYCSLALVAVVWFYWIDRERLRRKESVEKMRKNIAGNLREQLSAELGNINVLSEMARMKADKEPDKSKEFIEMIRNKSGTIIHAVEDMLWSISPDNDSMQKAMSRMQEFIDEQNNVYNTNIELRVDEKVKLLKLNMQFRHESFLLFKESITGLLKAGARNCTIHLSHEKDDLIYVIQFGNEDCNMQQLYNLLQSQAMARRLEILKASLVTDIKKSCSSLLLKIPVD